MPKYEVAVAVEIEDAGDEDAAFQRVDALMQQHHDQTGKTLDWHFTMVEVTNVTEQQDAAAPKSTCRHCGRQIVNNPDEGWVCPEAGFDMDGDGIWRATCEDNHEDRIGAHEPVEALTLCVHCGEPCHVDDNGEGIPVIVHDFGSTVCHDDPPGSHEDGDTTTVAELT